MIISLDLLAALMMKTFIIKNTWKIVGTALILIYILIEAKTIGDLEICFDASRTLLKGENIYKSLFNDNLFHYYYSVFFAIILIPFSMLPFYLAKVIWLLGNVFFLYRIWKIFGYYLPFNSISIKKYKVFAFVSFVFVISFVRDNFHFDQMTILMLYLIFEGIYQLEKGKLIPASLLLALGVDIKLLPIVILPYLFYRKQWKAGLLMMVFILLLILIPGLFIGFEFNFALITSRWELLNPMNSEHILDYSERSFHSLTSLLSTLLTENAGDSLALDLKRNIADISYKKLVIVINVVRLGFILFTLYFLNSLPFRKAGSKLQKFYELSYICLIIPLIFPHQQPYAFFLVFPASTYLLFYLFKVYFSDYKDSLNSSQKSKKIILIVVLVIIFLLLNGRFILGEYQHYYEHYKTLTYGALLMIILLAISQVRKLEKVS